MLKFVVGLVVGAGIAVFAAWYVPILEEMRLRHATDEAVTLLKNGRFADAAKELEPLARGNGHAQRLLARLYAMGVGVPMDQRLAHELIRKAECHCDDPGAIELSIAFDYKDGVLVDKDHSKYVQWLSAAASAGNRTAAGMLADMSDPP